MTGINYGSKEVREIYYASKEFATQGPCPDGFHIPTKDELLNRYNIRSDFGVGLTNFNNYMLMPMAGYRTYDGTAYTSDCYLWSCTSDGGSFCCWTLSNSEGYNVSGTIYDGSGYYIRPFYNTAIEADSSWETLYEKTYSAGMVRGIYHNNTLGLISINNLGVWTTIANKNVGATTVYRPGDTLTDSNCGKVFQWGNCYGFPRTGSITTSSTRVNVSSYGPGQYNVGTFITGGFWGLSTNENLRGGVTGNEHMLKKIKEVWYGSKKVWSADPTDEILKAIQNSDTTKLDAITTDGSKLKLLISSTACTNAFIAKNTLLQSYVSKMWNTVTTDTTNFSLVANTYGDDSWGSLVTNAATANSITFFAGGYYSSTSTYGWMKHRDGSVAKIGNKGGQRPQSVTTSNVEGVSFVGATFGQCGSSTSTTTSGDGYVAAATYKVK